MKKYFVLSCLLVSCLSFARAQEVLLKQDVKDATQTGNFGPNQKYYLHAFVGYGFIVGAAEEKTSRINYGYSHDWQIGLRFKFKVAEFYALGLDATLNPQTYYLKQKEPKNLPDTNLHGTEKLRLTNVGLGFFNRFNFDKRGDYMGNFLDLGIFGNWLPVSTHIYHDEFEDTDVPGASQATVKLKNLNYLTNFNYGVTARVGFNRYVFYATHRLSDLFNAEQGKDFAELPRTVIGFELGLHK